jgi:hypothetical protein
MKLPYERPEGKHHSFDADCFGYTVDYRELKGQIKAVFDLMKDGEYRTLELIGEEIGKTALRSIGASLRNLRRPRYGGYIVERRGKGKTCEYAIKMEVGSGRDK